MKKRPLQVRILILALPVLSLFFFPAEVTFLLTIISAFVYPPSAIFIGALADIFYYSGSIPLFASGVGVAVCLFAIFVRYLIKTRIM